MGELFARRVSWADARKTLSQSSPGLVPTWAVYPWAGVGGWKPRGSDFSPGSPGMCVRSYSHDLGHQAPLWGSDPRAVPWRGSSLSPPQLLPLLCPHVGSQEGCAPSFSSPTSVSGSFSGDVAQHGGLG